MAMWFMTYGSLLRSRRTVEKDMSSAAPGKSCLTVMNMTILSS